MQIKTANLDSAIKKLKSISDEIGIVSQELKSATLDFNQLKLSPLSSNPLIKSVINDSCSLAKNIGLLGVHTYSTNSSITVSGTMAVGLETIGAHEEAMLLVNNINKYQLTAGENKGGFAAPSSDGQTRPPHIIASFWGLYSNVYVCKEAASPDVIELSAEYFLDRQTQGGWGLSIFSRVKPFYTAHALFCLVKTLQSNALSNEKLVAKIHRAIHDGAKYLIDCQTQNRIIAWSENGKRDESPHLYTTIYVIQALEEYQNFYGKRLIPRLNIEETFYSYLKPELDALLVKKDSTGWPGILETEAPTFQTILSIPAVCSILLDIGIMPWDGTITSSVGWVTKHIIQENGLHGIDAGAPEPNIILNWSTGNALTAIGKWERTISNTSKINSLALSMIESNQPERPSNLEYIDKLHNSNARINHLERLTKKLSNTLYLSLAIFLIIIIINNLGWLSGVLSEFWNWLNNLAENHLINFAIGFIGLLPILVAASLWIIRKVNQKKSTK